MRTATLIVGIASATIILLASILRLFHLPGHIFLTMIGSLLFIVPFAPMLLAYQLQQTRLPIVKISQVISFMTYEILGTGLLFLNMRWPGGAVMYYLGLVIMTAAIVLYILSFSADKTTPKKINIFTFLTPLILVLLFLGKFSADMRTAHLDREHQIQSHLDSE